MITLEDVQEAAQLLQGRIIRTPLVYSPTFSRMSGAEVYLKLENLQKGGSFKIRGATYKILSRLDEIGPKGVVAASAGNHAQGVALAARGAGIPATIVMPQWASISKQEATKAYGAEVVLQGESLQESIQVAKELAREGRTFIHPYDDQEIITGQATIALEILQDLPDPNWILVPVGGGGLIGGIATAAKALRPQTKMVGVETTSCPSAYRSRQEGKIVTVEAGRSIADGISVKQVGEATFPIIQEMVDDIVLVEEDQIASAILALLERKKVLAEGAGAVALAALLNQKVPIQEGDKVVLVISGGNVDSPLLDRIIRQGLLRNGRIMRFSVCIDDVPGSLARLLNLVAGLGGNVLHIHHARGGKDLPIYAARVDLEVETRGPAHIEDMVGALKEHGYLIQLR
jgi:threonine dehydratase